ncbi:MAG: pseudouridine synthase [Planctomycetota bacterium]|nr:MAG: pseudouridine synthase [Planctomycetota bacterium]
MIRLEIGEDEAGQRVDRLLRKILPGAQLGFLMKLFRQKKVRRNGVRAQQNERLEVGDELLLKLPERLAQELGREAAPRPTPSLPGSEVELELLLEDEDLLAVLKPAGVLVQPGLGDHAPDLTTRVRRRYAKRFEARSFQPSPAHRLDLGTSGLVLFGMSAAGLRELSAAFRERRVEKRYLALVQGRAPAAAGSIDVELSEGQGRKGRAKTVPGAGRAARTDWRVLSAGARHSLLELQLHTGRLHQIRAHLKTLGLPIVGDLRYGAYREMKMRVPPRSLLLHAWRLRLAHPLTGAALELEAPLPGYFQRALELAGLPLPA